MFHLGLVFRAKVISMGVDASHVAKGLGNKGDEENKKALKVSKNRDVGECCAGGKVSALCIHSQSLLAYFYWSRLICYLWTGAPTDLWLGF
jgi:hypothetical protein